jgi:integrase
MNQLRHRWLEVLDVEASTRHGYVKKTNKHIRPMLGYVPVFKVDV